MLSYNDDWHDLLLRSLRSDHSIKQEVIQSSSKLANAWHCGGM